MSLVVCEDLVDPLSQCQKYWGAGRVVSPEDEQREDLRFSVSELFSGECARDAPLGVSP